MSCRRRAPKPTQQAKTQQENDADKTAAKAKSQKARQNTARAFGGIADESDDAAMEQAGWTDGPALPPSGSAEEKTLFLSEDSVKAATSAYEWLADIKKELCEKTKADIEAVGANIEGDKLAPLGPDGTKQAAKEREETRAKEAEAQGASIQKYQDLKDKYHEAGLVFSNQL